MHTSWTTTRLLLGVDRRQLESVPRSSRAAPILVGVLNLFFCAYAERYLGEDLGGVFLSLFFFLEASCFIVLVTVQYLSVTEQILSRIRTYPTVPWSRFLFAALAGVRRPVCIVLWGTTSFALLLLNRHSMASSILVPLLYTFLLLDLQLIMTTSLLVVSRRGYPATALIALFAILTFALLLGFLVFQFTSVLTGMPFLSWAVAGVVAVNEGNIPSALISLSLLGVTLLIGIEAGRRFA